MHEHHPMPCTNYESMRVDPYCMLVYEFEEENCCADYTWMCPDVSTNIKESDLPIRRLLNSTRVE